MTGFGSRLKEIRSSKKVTQKAMAEYLEIQETSYQMYEYDKREPSFETLVKICDHLQISADYLLGRSDKPKRI